MAILDGGDAEEAGMEGPPIFRPHSYPHLLPGIGTKAYVVTFGATPDHATRLLHTGDTLDGCFAAIKAVNPYDYGTQQIIDELKAVDYTLSIIMEANVETLICPVGGDRILMEPRYMELCFSIYDADQVPGNARITESFLRTYEEDRERMHEIFQDHKPETQETF